MFDDEWGHSVKSLGCLLFLSIRGSTIPFWISVIQDLGSGFVLILIYILSLCILLQLLYFLLHFVWLVLHNHLYLSGYLSSSAQSLLFRLQFVFKAQQQKLCFAPILFRSEPWSVWSNFPRMKWCNLFIWGSIQFLWLEAPNDLIFIVCAPLKTKADWSLSKWSSKVFHTISLCRQL